ncbi:hypothetical protein POM88_045035 [Heracleum sosnowskyi]|uniref:Nuclear pore complex protein Nup85 n=1 Tax=Heracleum sosnowskyi TaxID=360622 RepID=A0AAD8H569_9APIA|nr:hypothetical protein POM88_045035 [Heracleum sosnowskyi]
MSALSFPYLLTKIYNQLTCLAFGWLLKQTENSLVETVVVLVSKMPRLRPNLSAGKLDECYETKPDFVKVWEKWRGQITKPDCSSFWLQCGHQDTREGLKRMLHIILGNASDLSAATFHWVELFIGHTMYIRRFTVGMENMYSLAQVLSSHALTWQPIPLPFAATAQSVQTMIIGCLLTGIGIGISYIIVPLYISEISPSKMHGTLGSINQLFICVGIFTAVVAGVPLASNPLWRRTMFGIAAIPSVLLAVGKISEAEVAVERLFGKERVAEVMNDLDVYSQGSTKPEAGWSNLFSSRNWKVVNIGAAMTVSSVHVMDLVAQRYLVTVSGNDDAWALDTAQKPYAWQKLTLDGDRPSARIADEDGFAASTSCHHCVPLRLYL